MNDKQDQIREQVGGGGIANLPNHEDENDASLWWLIGFILAMAALSVVLALI